MDWILLSNFYCYSCWYTFTFVIASFYIHLGLAIVNVNNSRERSLILQANETINTTTCTMIDFNQIDDKCLSVCNVNRQIIDDKERDHNIADDITTVFTVCPDIEKLSINDSKVLGIPENAFTNATSLKFLYMARNLIEEVPSNIFKDAHLLTIIDLSDNRIHLIADDALKKLNKLMVLDLSANNLTSLHPKLIHDCTSLTTLILKNNGFIRLELHFTSRILQHIDTSYNNLMEIALKTPTPKKQQNFTQRNYSNVTLLLDHNRLINITVSPALQIFELSLANNSLTQLIELMNIRPFNAKILNLDYNKLTYFDPKQLQFSNKLERLLLKGNNLSDIDVQELKIHFLNLEWISLGDNYWECKDLKKILTQLTTRKIKIIDTDINYNDPNINGIRCFDTKSEITQLRFEYTAKLNKIILITVCTAAILVILMCLISINSFRTIQRLRSDSLSKSFEIKMMPTENVYNEEHVYNNVYSNPTTPTTTL